MKSVPIVLTGYGNVGKAFVRLLADKRMECARRYGLDLDLKAVLRSTGGWLAESRDDAEALTAAGDAPLESHPGWIPGLKLDEVLKRLSRGVLAEATPSDWRTGAPQLAFLHRALDAGWNVAAASKGALVVDFRNLTEKAAARGLALKYSGATAAALPTLDIATISLAGAEIQRIDGILTGTTNYILSRLEAGGTFASALAAAQAQGIAEPDPSMDIDGWDTACKLLLIANASAGTSLTLADIKVEGIRGVSAEMLAAARSEGKAVKLLGRLTIKDGRAAAEVRPIAVEPSHPLHGLTGTAKGIAFLTDSMGTIVVTGGKSDPRGTAAAMLKDIINTYR
ncbi:MAG: homoserine dehydrogenase [Candidatus Aminicenantes bacterium]|nr:homoserine dehydrogenase [Candidatus Aminicenantes bacterium]